MAAKTLLKSYSMLVGSCVASNSPNAVKVQVQLKSFNNYLKMYFDKIEYLYAHDEEGKCKDGDIVLLKKLDVKASLYKEHEVVKILYKLGDMVDPVTGRTCVSDVFRDVMKKKQKFYGVREGSSGGFDYESAPERGWQEGRKDFSHKPVYRRFHKFEEGHELHDDPSAKS